VDSVRELKENKNKIAYSILPEYRKRGLQQNQLKNVNFAFENKFTESSISFILKILILKKVQTETG
jgi:hypothetical protein